MSTPPELSTPPTGWGSPRHPRLAALFGIELLFMVAQYLAGMFLNLYATIPPVTGAGGMMGGGMFAFMSSSAMPALMFHMMDAVLLLLVALALVVGSLLARERDVLTVTVLLIVGVVAAMAGGLAYLFFRSEADSLLMSIGFLLAFAMTTWGLALAWRGPAPARFPDPQVPNRAEGR